MTPASSPPAHSPNPAPRGRVLVPRALNRALLARQHLLERATLSAAAAVEWLVGMQGQAPNAPYVGLWTRLDGFEAAELASLVRDRAVVRAPLLRATIHLVTAADCLRLRPLVQPVLERGLLTGSPYGRQLAGVALPALVDAARQLVDERPRTRVELAERLGARWPAHDPTALAYAATYLLPLVQVTPRGVWGETAPPAWTTVEAWLGRPLDPDASGEAAVDAFVLRYLAAYGPASVADAQSWSGLTRLRAAVERLRPRLAVFADDRGRELFDLPGAPRPDADTPAPPRFLPEYDNVLFGHADRRRVLPDGRRPPVPPGNGGTMGTLLVDGLFAGTWRITRRRGAATLAVAPFAPLPVRDRERVAEEGARLLAFAAGEATASEVRFGGA